MEAPIFVVGPSRGGTSMVVDMLGRHNDIYISSETHYFDDLRTQFEDPAHHELTPEEATEVQNYFLRLSHRPYGHDGDAEMGWMDRAEMAKLAEANGNTPDAYLEAFIRMESRDPVKRILGEKTPRHVFRIADILARYPDARIVAMVRDARAVVASYRDWENQGGFDLEADPEHEEALRLEQERVEASYHPLVLSMLWRGQVNAMLTAREEFGHDRVRLVMYEELATNPEQEVRELCTWLNVAYDPDMLEVAMSNSSVETFSQGTGISTQAINRWKTRLSPTEVALIESVAGKALTAVGYDLEKPKAPVADRAKGWASLPVAGYRGLMANKDRVDNPALYVLRRIKAAAGR